MSETLQADHEEPRLRGASVWLLTDGTAEQQGWAEPMIREIQAAGAGSAQLLGISGVLGTTARGMLEQGAERLARTLRLGQVGQAGDETVAHEAFARFRPDLILVDAPQLVRPLSLIRDVSAIKPVIVGLVTDLQPSESWQQARPDAWIVPDDGLLTGLRRPEQAEAALQVAGPPLAGAYAAPVDGGPLREQLAVGDDLLVLVDASTMPAALIERTMRELSRVRAPVRLLFHYGRNLDGADALRQSAAAAGVRANMFGATPSLPRYASAADVVIVGAANPLVAGYLALGIPLLSLDPAASSNVATRRGAMVPLPDVSALSGLLTEIAQRGVAPAHRDAAAAAVDRDGTRRVVLAAGRILAARDRLVQVPRAGGGGSPIDEGETRPGSGLPFETIGDAPPAISRSGSGAAAPLGREAARRALAELILEERRVEREVEHWARERDRWLQRVDDAKEEGDAELEQFARGQLTTIFDELRQRQDELGRLAERRDEVRRQLVERAGDAGGAASSGPGTPGGGGPVHGSQAMEQRFRELEMRRQLRRLKGGSGS